MCKVGDRLEQVAEFDEFTGAPQQVEVEISSPKSRCGDDGLRTVRHPTCEAPV